MIRSKLTRKAQTTVPQAVRRALSLNAGDEIAYAISGDSVVMLKVEEPPEPVIDWDPFALFTEWNSEEDRQDWGD